MSSNVEYFDTNRTSAIRTGSKSIDDWVIQVKNLGKKYHIYNQPMDQLKHLLLWRFGKRYGQEFWALKEVSFEVKKGEIFGIIGRNGAGKSTILQMLTGILFPTEGEMTIRGRVAALLELGSGFNPETTGRENIYISGAILGLNRKQIMERFDEIISFADIGDFIDQPIKCYSSGMLARLAFAVHSCITPDIFIIDEALSVGDIFFQQKCSERIRSLAERGTTLILVSHDMNVIRTLCRRALLLDRGRLLYIGNSNETVLQYYQLKERPSKKNDVFEIPLPHTISPQEIRTFLDKCQWIDRSCERECQGLSARIVGVSIQDRHGNPSLSVRMGESASVRVLVQSNDSTIKPGITLVVQNRFNHIVFSGGAYTKLIDPPLMPPGSYLFCTIEVQFAIEAGQYTLQIRLSDAREWDVLVNRGQNLHHTPLLGPMHVNWDYERDRAPFLGAFDLPCRVEYHTS